MSAVRRPARYLIARNWWRANRGDLGRLFMAGATFAAGLSLAFLVLFIGA